MPLLPAPAPARHAINIPPLLTNAQELLDGSGGGNTPSGAPRLKHTKRPTDNRQSKGRRLSHEVQAKLLNFMFPEIPERPVILSELFASVFGQRVADLHMKPAAGDGTRRQLHERAPPAPRGEELAVPVSSLFAQ